MTEFQGLSAGKVIGVTGAASGIGRATALLAAAEGAAGLLLADMNGEPLEEVAQEARSLGAHVEIHVGSVTADDGPEEFVACAARVFGRLDVAVNNAGVAFPPTPIHEMDDALWEAILSVDLTAVFRHLRAELRYMYEQGEGVIVNIASAGIFGVVPGISAYIASKQGVVGLTHVAAHEAGPAGVRVNAVCPGRTVTPMSGGIGISPETLVTGIPLGRMASPSEIAEAVIWMASERSSFVNGEILVVDGGRTV